MALSFQRYATLTVVFFTLLWAGVIINILQALSAVLWYTGHIKAYRDANAFLASQFLSVFAFMIRRVAQVKIRSYGDPLSSADGNLLSIANHTSDVDWMLGMDYATQIGRLGDVKAIAKESWKTIPTVGYLLYFCETIFIKRQWQEDRAALSEGLQHLANYGRPFWMVLFAEGTRMTPDKLAASQQFARDNKLPVLEHVLLPRTKAFVACAQTLRGALDTVYDMTICFPPPNVPKITDCFLGPSSKRSGEAEAIVIVNKIPMSSLPTEEAALEKWLVNRFQIKDQILDGIIKSGYKDIPFAPAPSAERDGSLCFFGWLASLVLSVLFLGPLAVVHWRACVVAVACAVGLVVNSILRNLSHSRKGTTRPAVKTTALSA